MVNIKALAYGAALLSSLLLGTLGVFVRNISVNVYILTFLRVILGLIFLVLFMWFKKELYQIKKVKFSFSLLITGGLLSLGILCYTHAINHTSLANAVFLLYLGPLIAVGIASIFLKESFTLEKGVLLCLAFLGFLFLLEFKFSINLEESKGALWGIAASLCYAFFIIFNQKISKAIPLLTCSFYQFFVAALVILPFIDRSIFKLTPSDMFWLTGMGFFQGFLAITLLIWAIKHLKTIEYGTISYMEPLIASILGYLLYSEHLTPLQMIGCILIFSIGLIQVLSVKKL